MPSHQLSELDQDRKQELLELMETLEQEEAFQVYAQRLQQLMAQKSRNLLSATSSEEVFRRQGECLGIKASIDAFEDIKRELSQK